MSGGVKQLKKGEVLFNEGDSSDAMYVIKSGRISITKKKGASEIELAELKNGQMLGEMAFFDNQPRSAGARAKTEATVIILPFSALHAQFKTFPEWLKAMVKTVNSHLRDANLRIKNLEKTSAEEAEALPPHAVNRLCAILNFVTLKFGRQEGDGLIIPQNTLRNYTIQVFQMPTNKMDKMTALLSSLGIMNVEELGEGKQKITIFKPQLLSDFVDWYNTYLFKDESKRITLIERELPLLKGLAFYGKRVAPNDKGEVQISLTEMQQNAVRDLGFALNANDVDSLAKKGLIPERQSATGGEMIQKFSLAEIDRIIPFWEIIFATEKLNRS